MVRGDNAKKAIVEKMKSAFGADWIGEQDKKFYVWAQDGADRVQISIALTCPKTFIEAPAPTPAKPQSAGSVPIGGWDFENMPTPVEYKPAEITDQEKNNIEDMMKRLGLI